MHLHNVHSYSLHKKLKHENIAPLLAYFLALTLIGHQEELNDNCAIHGCNMFIPTSQSVYGCGLDICPYYF
jgi:hypothetical protein